MLSWPLKGTLQKAVYCRSKGHVLHREMARFILQYAANQKAGNFPFIDNVLQCILPKHINVLFSTI